MKSVIAFLKDESGQTTVEYVLLLVVAAVLVFKLKGEAETGIGTITSKVFSTANEFVDKIGTTP